MGIGESCYYTHWSCAVTFSSSSILLLVSIGLFSVYHIFTLVLPILIILEDQLIMLTPDGIVC